MPTSSTLCTHTHTCSAWSMMRVRENTINHIKPSSSLASSSSIINGKYIHKNMLYLLRCLEVVFGVCEYKQRRRRQRRRRRRGSRQKKRVLRLPPRISVRFVVIMPYRTGIYGKTKEEQIMYLFALDVNSQKYLRTVMCISLCLLPPIVVAGAPFQPKLPHKLLARAK